MQRTRVKSSNIASIGYNSSTNTLEIEFLNKSIYHYFRVPTHIYNSLMSAASHGKYLAAHIKGRYSYKKV